MKTYKVLFWWGKVRRQEYVDAEKLDDALKLFRQGQYGEHDVISIIESDAC